MSGIWFYGIKGGRGGKTESFRFIKRPHNLSLKLKNLVLPRPHWISRPIYKIQDE